MWRGAIFVGRNQQKVALSVCHNLSASTSAAQNTNQTLHIPNKIKRSPTAILQALSSVTSRDPLSMPYDLADTPELAPVSNFSENKMLCSLARQAGQQTARSIAAEYPTLFEWDRDEPRLEAFRPVKRIERPDTGNTEQHLLDRLQRLWITNAMDVYENCELEGVALSEDTILKLLEYVCFYNCADPSTDTSEWPIDRWYHRALLHENQTPSPLTWLNGNLAEALLKRLGQNARAISAVIVGQCKYANAQQAMQRYKQMCAEGLIPTEQAYNWLLHSMHQCVSGTAEKIYSELNECFEHMLKNGVQPSASTWVAMAHCIQNIAVDNQQAIEYIQKLLSDISDSGHKIPLGVFHSVLVVYERQNNGLYLGDVLSQCLHKIQQQKLTINDMTSDVDYEFFVRAMDIAGKMGDLELVQSIYVLSQSGHNELYLNEYSCATQFYEAYINNVVSLAELSVAYKAWAQNIPWRAIASPPLVHTLIQSMKHHEQFELLPLFWPDILAQNYQRGRSIRNVLQMCQEIPYPSYRNGEQLRQNTKSIMLDYCAQRDGYIRGRLRRHLRLDPMIALLNNILLGIMHLELFDDLDSAWKEFEFFEENAHTLMTDFALDEFVRGVGTNDLVSFIKLLKHKTEDFDKCARVAQLIVTLSPDENERANSFLSRFQNLSSAQQELRDRIVTSDYGDAQYGAIQT